MSLAAAVLKVGRAMITEQSRERRYLWQGARRCYTRHRYYTTITYILNNSQATLKGDHRCRGEEINYSR